MLGKLLQFIDRKYGPTPPDPVPPAKSIDYIFRNNRDPIIVIIEPWAEEILLEPGSKMVVRIYYEKFGNIDTELTPQYFVIGLWHRCRAEVFLNGENRTPGSLSIPAFG